MRVPHSALLLLAVSVPHAASAQSNGAPPPGRRYSIGGIELHLHCAGAGSPVVVIDGGASTWSLHYRPIQDLIAPETRVCTYDRAGLGWSDASPRPRTSGRMAEELYALLRAAGEPAPYVLVGHSLGGYNVRLLAAKHPQEVGAVVLLESGHEDQWERLPSTVGELIQAGAAQLRQLAGEAEAGRLAPEAIQDGVVLSRWPALRALHAQMAVDPTSLRTRAAEMEGAASGAAEVAATGRLGRMPVLVLSADRSFDVFGGLGIPIEAANRVWSSLQADLLGVSDNSWQLIASGATHEVPWERPEWVAGGILKAVGWARRELAREKADRDHGAALDRMWQRYVPAIEAEDLATIRTFFAVDAVLLPPYQGAVEGVDAALDWFAALFSGHHVALEMPTDELRVLGNDVAYRRGRFRVILTPKAGGPAVEDHGKFIQIYERQADGEWRIARGILNSDLPRQAP